jgi:hypothetical protein
MCGLLLCALHAAGTAAAATAAQSTSSYLSVSSHAKGHNQVQAAAAACPTWWCDALADVILAGWRAPVVVRPARQVEVTEAAAAAAAAVELGAC